MLHYDVEISNIKSISNLSCRFLPGVNLVTGKNGSGKSTLCNSLYYCLRASSKGSKSYRHLIKRGESEGHIKISFTTSSNQEMTLERVFHLKDSTKFKATIDGNSLQVEDGTKIIPEIFLDLIYLNYDKIDPLYFFDVDEYLKEYSKKLQYVKNLEGELEKIKIKMTVTNDTLEKNIKNLKTKIDELDKKETEFNNKRAKLKEQVFFDSIEVLEEFERLLEEAKQEYNIWLNEENNRRSIAIKELERELELQKKEVEEIKKKLIQERKNLEEKHSLEEKNELAELQKNINLRKGEITATVNSYKNQLQNFKKIENEKNCPVCGQKLDPITIEQMIVELDEKIKEQTELLMQLEENKRKSESEIREKYSKIKKEKIAALENHYKSQIEQSNIKIKELEDKVEKAKQSVIISEEEKIEKQKEIKKKYFKDKADIINSKFLQSQKQLIRDLIEIEKEISRIAAEKENIRKEIVKLQNELYKDEDFKTVEEKINKLKVAEGILQYVNRRNLNKFISEKVYDIFSGLCTYYSTKFDVKVLPELKETKDGFLIEFGAKNLHGEVVSLNELSSGEGVIAKIIINMASRKFIRMLPEYKNSEFIDLLFIDEYLDRLDENNAVEIVSRLSEETDFIFVIVTHRADLINSFSYVNLISL
ncbi:MAG: AAA family ATPase [Endomicrobia bacterium]|nr:AAA family ATPase [Endomicrobiia bacterium]